ncbi:MAG: hypothetical protein ACREUU_14835 [Gammaproteobacteria bacterium]
MEGVEKLAAKLNVDTLANPEVLEDREVEVPGAITANVGQRPP